VPARGRRVVRVPADIGNFCHRKCGRVGSAKGWRGASRLLLSLVVTGALAPILIVGLGSETAGALAPETGFYLALGASASVGIQPTTLDPHGARTPDGYANDIVAYEAARGVTLDLTQMGCPGETTSTMISGGDACYHQNGSQLGDAMAFLSDHAGEAGIVTIDLGFNDLRQCHDAGAARDTCISTQIATLQRQLPFIVQSLQAVAGPRVTFVGVGHYDPYLADAISGRFGARIAMQSESVMNRLNGALLSIYLSDNIPMATVSDYFDVNSHRRVDFEGVGDVSNDVAHACELTWMCAPAPYGPNVHPNDRGYALIAAAIESQLHAPW
jgi:lysophospholipase L1-like esterase